MGGQKEENHPNKKEQRCKTGKWLNDTKEGKLLENQVTSHGADKYGYSGGIALLVVCMSEGIEIATEDFPEKLKTYIRGTIAERVR